MMKVMDFIKGSFMEMTQKVSWPSWQELQSSAIVVLIALLMIALAVLVMDESIGGLLKLFYKSLS